MSRAYSVNLQIAVNVEVDIEAENFEEAVVRGREMVQTSRSSTHMLKRSLAKTDNAVQIQDTEAHFIGVRDNDAGCMYK